VSQQNLALVLSTELRACNYVSLAFLMAWGGISGFIFTSSFPYYCSIVGAFGKNKHGAAYLFFCID